MWRSRAALTRLIGEHLTGYPVMQFRDVYKLLYQGALGPKHFITSPETFVARLRAEYQVVSPDDTEPLWEAVRPDGALGRLNLRPFKAQGGEVELLNAACLATAEQSWGTADELRTAWAFFASLCETDQLFPLAEMSAFAAWLEKHDYPAVHHSARYAEAYQPAYRLLSRELLLSMELPSRTY